MIQANPRRPHSGQAILEKTATILAFSSLAGCAREGAASYIVAGSYFPAWMACAFAGIFVALALRVLFGRLRIDGSIAYRLTFYLAVAIFVSAAIWFYGFG